MASSEPGPADSENSVLAEVIADYVRAVEDGDPPDREQLLSRHPALATELREFFQHRDRMTTLLRPLRDAAARVLNTRCPHCHSAIELLEHAEVSKLSCPSCGSDFSLVSTESTRYPNGRTRIGHFQLVEQVGIGQFGNVWKARDLTLERIVAVKIPRRSQLSRPEAEMFLRDARLTAQLNHPNIVGVHEVGKLDDTIFIVTDFIQGTTLKEKMASKRYSVREAVELCVIMAGALHHAHEAGVIHRDLKPGNIMLDLAGRPHIVDFGLAKRDSGELTITADGQILGTPAYMSPEQARGDGHDADRRADVYSLGVILFEMLTGELPFRGDKATLLLQIMNEPAPSPRKLNARLPRDLETICLKCLEKEPHRRYATARLLADDCARLLRGEGTRARPISRMTRAWRRCRRRPLVAGLSAVVAALVVGIALVSSLGLWATRAALSIAQQRADTIEQNLYYSQMNRAGVAARDPEGLAHVSTLLEHWRPSNKAADRRGWEWYYLRTLLRQDLATLQVHDGTVFSVEWSSDGSLLATTCGRAIKLFNRDGRVIFTLSGHQAQVNSVAWNQDGTRLATASFDGTVKIWEVSRGEVIKTLRHAGQAVDARWSPNDQQLAVASLQDPQATAGPSVVTIWNTADWQQDSASTFATRLSNLRWHPTQAQIALGSPAQVLLWDPATGKERTLEAQEGGLVAWNANGTRLAAGNYGDMVIWAVGRQEIRRIAKYEAKRLAAPAWQPGGSLLAFVAGHKVVRLTDESAPAHREWSTLQGHRDRVTTVCWHPSGERLATASTDGTVKIWSANTGSRFRPGSYAISWSPDGSRYVSTFRNSVLICRLRDAHTAQRLGEHECQVFAVAWSPDGMRVASASVEGEVRVWNARMGGVLWSAKTITPHSKHGSPLPTVLTWSPDGRRLAFPQANFAIGIVDAANGKLIRELKGHSGAVRTVAWSPDGSYIVSGGQDQVLRIWNAETGRPAKVRDMRVSLSAVCWSPDGSRIAGAASDNAVYVWKLRSLPGPPLIQLSGHTNYVHTVSWSGDGQRIASADESGAIRLWDAHSGQQTLTLSYPRAVPMVAWNPDSVRLACLGFGGSSEVCIFDASTRQRVGPVW